MRPDFKNIDIKNAGFAATNAAEWAKANGIEPNWKTPEHIEVKPVYTKEDLENVLDDLDSSFSYSVDGNQMTLTEREYGEQFTFIRK